MISRPADLSEDEVFALFYAALLRRVEGPWVFAARIPAESAAE